ncbi:MAG TPA: PD-(D/E)XK nuclease family protein [Steroidobacteraceae bacterium]
MTGNNKAILQRLERGTVVVPSAQRAAALRLSFTRAALASGRTAWPSPDAFAWTAWLDREAALLEDEGGQLRQLSPTAQWWLWREAVREATADNGLLLADSLTAGIARASALLDEWELPLRAAPTEEAAVLLRARRSFVSRCAELEMALPLLPARRTTGALTVAGFGAPGPKWRRDLIALGAEFWQSATADDSDIAIEATRQAALDSQDELQRAAHWARIWLQRQPSARLLLVLPDLARRRAALTAVLDRTLAPAQILSGHEAEPLFAIEGGRPLAEQGLIAMALAALTLAVATLEFSEFAALLRSPWLACAPQSSLLALELWLREQGEHQFDVLLLDRVIQSQASMPGAARAALLALRAALALPAQNLQPPRWWAEQFAALLQRVGWPGAGALGSTAQQSRDRFLELVGEFALLGPLCGPLSGRAAALLLADLAGRRAFEPASEDVAITVTDQLGDPLVHYEGIWVAGLSAEQWPPPATPDPFIPLSLQRAAGIPQASAAGQLQLAAQCLVQWRACAGELVLSFAQRVDDVECSPSPWLRGADTATLPSGVDPLTQFLRGQAQPVERNDVQATPWPVGQALPRGTKVLELQSQCPFRACAQLRFGAEPLPEPSPGINALVRGRILHRALELLWQELGGRAGLLARSSELDSLLANFAHEAVAAERARAAWPGEARLFDIEARRVAGLLGQVLELERERAEFVIEALERDRLLTLAGHAVNLRLDRVDRLADDRFAVIDYKSGQAKSFQAFSERPERPQLLAYAVAVGEQVAAVAALHVQTGAINWRGLADQPDRLPGVGAPRAGERSWPQMLSHWAQLIEGLAAEFVAGRADVQPLPGVCRHCHLPLACRIGSAPDGAELLEAGDDE